MVKGIQSFIFVLLTLSLIIPSFGQAALITVCSAGCSQTTVQAGINAASNYDEVRIIDSREYFESVRVNVTGVTLYSNASTKPMIFYNGTEAPINISSGDVIIKNLTLKYNGSTSGVATLFAASVTNLTIANNTINNSANVTGPGIEFFPSVTSSRIENNTIAVGGTDFNVNNYNNVGVQIRSSSTNNNIINNTIRTTGMNDNWGIYVQGGSTGTSAIGNVIITNGTGSNYGIHLATSSLTANYNTISTNGVSSSLNYGIYAAGDSANVKYNTITTNGVGDNYGIYATVFRDNITGNNIYTSGRSGNNYGIFSSSVIGLNMIENNTIRTNGTSDNYGIYLKLSPFNTVANNTVKANGTGSNNHGIFLSMSSNYGKIFQNSVLTNGTASSYGIFINSSSYSNVSASNITTVFSATDYGVVFAGNSTGNNITDSYITALLAPDIRDESNSSASANFLINVSFNKADIDFLATANGTVYVQYRVDALVQDQANGALSGASVVINDTDSHPNYYNLLSNLSVSTNVSGRISTVTLTEFFANRTHNSSSGYIYFSNYTFLVSKNGYSSNSTSINLTESTSLSFTIQEQNICNVDSAACFVTIQQAINSASAGQTLRIIMAKEFNEAVVVNRSVTITSNTSSFPMIFSDASSLSPHNATVNITANNVIIMKVNIVYNGTAPFTQSMASRNASNITLTNITVASNGQNSNYGIYLRNVSNSTVSSSIVITNGTGPTNYGIYVFSTSNWNTITSNVIRTNGTNDNYGIYLNAAHNNTIITNTVYTSGTSFFNFGIAFTGSSTSNAIISNSVRTNGTSSNYGISLNQGLMNNITGNTIITNGTSSSNFGISFNTDSQNNALSWNTIVTDGTQSNEGIRFSSSSSGNHFSHNSIVTNGPSGSSHGISFLGNSVNDNFFRNISITTNGTGSYGVRIVNTSNSTFHDSIINSMQDYDFVVVEGNSNNATYLVNVSFNKSDINFSSSSVGAKLFVQYRFLVRVIDGSSNAVDQAAINITDNGTFSVSSLLPAINLSSNSSGYASEVNLAEFMANYTYQPSISGYLYFGSYYFNASKSGYSTSVQSAVNESKTITLTLSSLNPPTTTTVSSGGGGGGGGGGGSSTSTEAKQSILIITVKPNTAVKGTFTNTLLDLREISFSSKTEATNARIEATQTSTKPSTALDLTNTGKESYKTYAYIDVTHTNIADADLTNVKLAFEINKSWLSDRGYTKDQVFLQRYADGKWSKLTTRLLSEDTKKYKFEADSPGLSTFVISIAVPVGAGVSTGGNAAPSVTEETTTTTVTESKQEETAKGGSPFATLFFVLILIIAGGAYAFKDKIKVRRA